MGGGFAISTGASVMKKERDWLSVFLLSVAIVGIVMGFFPQADWYFDPGTNEHVTEWTLGFKFSPLWTYSKREAQDGSFVWQAGIQILSWSWIPFAVGATTFELWSRRKRKRMETLPSQSKTP